MYNLKVIKIKRGRKHINIPEGGERLQAGDWIWLLGDARDLANFSFYCRENNLLLAAEENADADLTGKTLRESSMRQDWSCFLLGLERNMLPIMNPSPDMVLESGDLVWVLGGKSMGEALVAEGLV